MPAQRTCAAGDPLHQLPAAEAPAAARTPVLPLHPGPGSPSARLRSARAPQVTCCTTCGDSRPQPCPLPLLLQPPLLPGLICGWGPAQVNVLLSLHHPNIVDVSEVVVDKNPDSVFMVMEFMDHELKALMDKKERPFSTSEVRTRSTQMVRVYVSGFWV